jgi:transcriptional regulator with XRE-family HTH domain
LGEHLKKRRRELGLYQREVAARMGIGVETYANWEKSKTEPVTSQFRPLVTFLGYDSTPAPSTLAARLQAKRRALGVTFSQVARYLGWNTGTLARYLSGRWLMPPDRVKVFETFLAAEEVDLVPMRQLPRRR